MKTRLGVMGLALAATALAVAETRTWTFNSGATIEAEIVGFPDATTVAVKRSDGIVYSLPFAYLTNLDRAYLAAQHAKQWKSVSVDKLLGTASAGFYKKCLVSGKDVNGEILIQLLPPAAESILNTRNQQAAKIADLASRLPSGGGGAAAGGQGHRRASRAQAKQAAQAAADARAALDKLRADNAEYLKKTKSATTVLMKNTGLVYSKLAVWECKDPRKAQ